MIFTSMTNLSNTRINRASAFAMLLVWVLALISGVANACLLEAPGTAAHAGATGRTNQHGVDHVALSRNVPIEADSDQADDGHTSKQPCLKICDDSSRSLPKKYPAGQIDPGLPVIVAVLWSLAEPIRLQYKQPNGTQHATLLPLRVLYARLVL